MSRVAYYATKDVFVQDVVYNRFIQKMKQGAALNHISAGSSEIISWQNNAPKVRDLLDVSCIPDSVIVSFEYKVPNGGRIDCMLYGIGANDKQNVVHIELKQWSNSTVRELYDNGVFRVDALTGGSFRPVCHPSQQVANYQNHLLNFVEELNRSDTSLSGLAYCYNYDSTANPKALYADHYKAILDQNHLYSGNELESLAKKLNALLNKGCGLEIFNRVSKSRIRQSEKLLDAAAGMFEGVSAFSLLDDQITASKAIFAEVKKAQGRGGKTVIVVKGGPGTGKTVIALDVLANMAKERLSTRMFFTTRSKALRTSLKERLREVHVGDETMNASDMIANIYQFKPYHYKEGEIDLLLVDEAHRVEKSANYMGDRFEEQTYLSMTHSLIYCSKVCVFFIDDKQAVKPTEIGNSSYIIDAANSYSEAIRDYANSEFYRKLQSSARSLEINRAKRDKIAATSDPSQSSVIAKLDERILELERVMTKLGNIKDVKSKLDSPVHTLEIELKSQFRCNGSDNFLDWLDEVLYLPSDKVKTKFEENEYAFEVCTSPQELMDKIRALNAPSDKPDQIARTVAGYCWKWSDELQPDGDLKKDVKIGSWEMPWETKSSRPRGIFRDMYASSSDTWAIEPQGINQLGCIFSVQGFELDYIGVILGPDIDYDEANDCLTGVPGHNHAFTSSDHEIYTKHVLNAYRVLMSRGRLGCLIYSVNPKVSEFLLKTLDKNHILIKASSEIHEINGRCL